MNVCIPDLACDPASLASLSGQPKPMVPAMDLALSASFASVERWREEFVAMGKALRGRSGWVLMSLVPRDGALVNRWVADHAQAPAGGLPILALDLHALARHRDDGAAAGACVDAFVENIDWTTVYARYQSAVTCASHGMGAKPDQAAAAQLFDVRRRGAFEQADAMIAGAEWRDPAQVGTWAARLPKDEPVVVYCLHGHEVGRATAMRLRAAGIDARFLIGGFDGWCADGRPVMARPDR